MGISLPSHGNIFVPQVPESLAKENKELYTYLNSLRRAILQSASGGFANAFTVAAAVNSGTSGTFTLSSGGSIVITSGIVIEVTS